MDKRLQRAQSLVGTSAGRPEVDYYPTPPEATHALLDAEKFEGLIWEPACGHGHMSDVLRERGHDVISTDIIDYGYPHMDEQLDFLNAPSDMIVDNIITNPPFSVTTDKGRIPCQAFVEIALKQSTKKVAILQKLAFLEGKERKAMFESTPLARVYVFSRRLTMTRLGSKPSSSGMIPFAWYVWDHAYTGEPVIRWIDHKEKGSD